MATLTTHRALELVELYLEIEPAPNDPDWLVLRGRAVLDRAAFGGKRASILGPQVRLELAVRARKLSRSPWRRTPQPRASRHRVGAHAGVFERLQELLLDELGVRGVRSAPVRVVADARIDQRWRAAGQVVR